MCDMGEKKGVKGMTWENSLAFKLHMALMVRCAKFVFFIAYKGNLFKVKLIRCF